jgi:hypothetical protein
MILLSPGLLLAEMLILSLVARTQYNSFKSIIEGGRPDRRLLRGWQWTSEGASVGPEGSLVAILKSRPVVFLSSMKGQIASVLIVAALLVGISIGYFWNVASSKTITQTYVTTYTTTLPGDSGVLQCVLTRYDVVVIASVNSYTTSYGNATQTAALQTYTSTTTAFGPIGFATTSTSPYMGTLVGALGAGNYTICTYIAG